MKLTKCYISSFGKLKDVSFDFNSSLNVFKEENGWGKSTLAGFIKCIFYGLKDGKRSVAENERTKYKPWNSTEKFGGYVEFLWANQSFRLERFFGNKSSEDTVRLIDLKTGKLFPNTDNLGERIFKIDEEGFLSTTYFSEKDFQVKSNTSITAKFNSVCEIQDTGAFDDALVRLEKKSKTYKMTGDKGTIAQTKREIFSVEEDIQKAKLAFNTASGLKLSADKLEKEVVELKDKVDQLTAKVTDAGKIEANAVKKIQYENLLRKKEQLTSEKQKTEKTLNGKNVSLDELAEYVKCNNELNKISERINILEKDIANIKLMPEQKSNEKKSKLPLIFVVLGALPLILAIIMIAVKGEFFTPITIFSFVAFVIVELSALLIKLFVKQEKEQPNTQLQQIYQSKLAELNGYKEIANKYAMQIDTFINAFDVKSFDRAMALDLILKAIQDGEKLEKELIEIQNNMALLGDSKEFLTNDNASLDLNSLKKQLSAAQEEYAYKARELANKRSDVKYFSDKADALSELEEKKDELSLDLARYKEEYEIVKTTIEYFKKADENLKTKYRAPLQESLNKYLGFIDGGKKKAFIDIDLSVTVEEQGSDKVTDYYSKGYQNLFEICKRFALTDVLFKEEKPFIILDDPFYNLDDEKLDNAVKLVKLLSEEYQILYFVCHESRRV